jgi:hypothetical protein
LGLFFIAVNRVPIPTQYGNDIKEDLR